jgi:peptidyl-prolyl cis-trans isomerase C
LPRSLLALALAAAALASCGRCGGKRTPGKEAPGAVAVVNGEPISRDAVQRQLAQVRVEGAEGEPPDKALRKQLLDDLIDRVLLLQQAHARSISIGQDQVERALLRLRADYPGTHFDDLLAQQRLSQAELRSQLREQLTMEKLFNDEVFPTIAVADSEVEHYYSEHAEEFEEPEQVHAFQVVVKTREDAQKVRADLLKRPQSFAAIARKSSIAPESAQGGDLGWFGKSSGMPEVFDVCFTLPLNTLSEVTPSPYGFHLFKVVARRAPTRRPFAETRDVIHERLLREKRTAAQQAYLAALRGRARIDIDEAALDAIAP